MKYVLPILVLFTALFLHSCAWFRDDFSEKSAQELVQDGIEEYDKGDYKDAIKNFQQLKDLYPFSKYAILAELKIADAHYYLKQYPEAIQAYEEFEQLHPRNEAVPYVIYQIGRSYYEQIDTIDRDQDSARMALGTFNRLIQQYPLDSYAQAARVHVLKCYQSLSGHELYVALYYFRKQNYQAALQRFLSVIHDYPDAGYHHQALNYIVQCEVLLAAQETAPRIYETTPVDAFEQLIN
jgi:outer membrane protein assembly factor BamD